MRTQAEWATRCREARGRVEANIAAVALPPKPEDRRYLRILQEQLADLGEIERKRCH